MSAPADFPTHKLVPHPDSPPSPVRAISIRAVRDGNSLALSYRLEGDLDAVRWPELAEPRHADNLWRHTCLEAFVGRAAASEYCEYNFSPSGAWAAYHFSGYRTDMRPHEMQPAPRFAFRREGEVFTAAGTVDLDWTTLRPGGTIRLGVTAVIEDASGGLSYWALKHPPGKPDFHHADGFVLDVL